MHLLGMSNHHPFVLEVIPRMHLLNKPYSICKSHIGHLEHKHLNLLVVLTRKHDFHNKAQVLSPLNMVIFSNQPNFLKYLNVTMLFLRLGELTSLYKPDTSSNSLRVRVFARKSLISTRSSPSKSLVASKTMALRVAEGVLLICT